MTNADAHEAVPEGAVEVSPGVWRKPPAWDPLGMAVGLWDVLEELPENTPTVVKPDVKQRLAERPQILSAGWVSFEIVWVFETCILASQLVENSSDLLWSLTFLHILSFFVVTLSFWRLWKRYPREEIDKSKSQREPLFMRDVFDFEMCRDCDKSFSKTKLDNDGRCSRCRSVHFLLSTPKPRSQIGGAAERAKRPTVRPERKCARCDYAWYGRCDLCTDCERDVSRWFVEVRGGFWQDVRTGHEVGNNWGKCIDCSSNGPLWGTGCAECRYGSRGTTRQAEFAEYMEFNKRMIRRLNA